MVREELLEGFGGFPAFGFDRAAVEENGEALAARNPALLVEDEGFGLGHHSVFLVLRPGASPSSTHTGV
jgi:hypothetical protein